MNEVRVRFAPSPTGTLHIGGARTALFNWLYAKKKHGKFILRLEDTDLDRSTESSAQGIVEGLRWLGLDWNEGPDIGGAFGPYRQSDRLAIYKKYLQQLLDQGKAYYCFCTPEELAIHKKDQTGYDGTCRNLSRQEIDAKLSSGLKPVIRFRTPADGTTVVRDLVRGQVSFNNQLLDDFIIAKSNGWPTYNFAVVVDDYSMKISHVIRAEEHLSNTPKQILIYEALGFDLPEFAHVSMILAPDRSKLSKRHGATSVQEFRDNGYLPETMINYLALLGWSPGEDLSFLSTEDLINRFSLDSVSKSAAIYDTEKLTWINGHYLALADSERISKLLEDDARQKGWLCKDNELYFKQVIDLVKSRAKTVKEMLDAMTYFFEDVEHYDPKGITKHFLKAGTIERMSILLDILQENRSFSVESLEEDLRSKAETLGMKPAELIHPARLALSGRTNTPGIFEVMALLGRDLCIDRIQKAIDFVKSQNA